MTPLLLPSEERALANKKRDEGMELAKDSAEARFPIWEHRAMDMLKRYLALIITPFMAEDFRHWAEENDLPAPPSARAYGSVMIKAAKAKLIVKIGYAKTSNRKAHRTPATLWDKYFEL